MPIRPELRHHYRGPQWQAARQRIRERAGDCCEQCGKPNRAIVETLTGFTHHADGRRSAWMIWRNIGPWTNHHGQTCWPRRHRGTRFIQVKCGAAHLNHVPGEDRDDNLRWLCDWCHLHYDVGHHKDVRSKRKDKARPILAIQEAPC